MGYNIRTLNQTESQKVDEWLKQYNCELNVVTRRDLSDVIKVVNLIKHTHGKLINMDDYTRRDGAISKYANWETFNFKVLSKLGLSHSKSALEELSKGKKGAIDSLLYDIITMGKDRVTNAPRSRSVKPAPKPKYSVIKSQSAHSLTHSHKVITVEVEEVINGKIVKTPRKLVPYDEYMKVFRQCQERDLYINIMDGKAKEVQSILDRRFKGPELKRF